MVLAIVLSPGDLTWIALAGPHSEGLARFKAKNVLVDANMETSVAWVELVASKAVDFGLVRHLTERPTTPSQFPLNFLSSVNVLQNPEFKADQSSHRS